MKRTATALVLVSLAVAGCSGGPVSSPEPQAPGQAPASSASLPATEDGTIKPASVTTKDSKGDADSGDVTEVRLVRDADQLRMTIKLSEPLVTDAGESGVFLNLSSTDGNVSMQCGIKWLDGDQIAYFIYDSETSQQENLDGEAVVNGKTITASFPVYDLAQLGSAWKWQLVTSIEGQDADTVPEPGDDAIRPKRGTLGTA